MCDQRRDYLAYHVEAPADVGIEGRERVHRLQQLCLHPAASTEPSAARAGERWNEVKARVLRREASELLREQNVFGRPMTREQEQPRA